MKAQFKVLAGRLLAAGVSTLLMHCGDPLAGGGTIETTNGMVAGSVLEEDGGQAARIQVQLIPAGFDPAKDTESIASTLTEMNGQFHFTRVPPGQYNVICKRHENHTSALVTGISVTGDTVSLAATLRASGSIGLTLPDTCDSEDGYVFIPGTGIWISLKAGRNVFLDSVPAGTIPRLCYATKKPGFRAIIRNLILVKPGNRTEIAQPGWENLQTIHLNTSISGASISEDVLAFPVLIRLTGTQFDFEKVSRDGKDLLFTKANGSALPHEIESWNWEKKEAEIWVHLDTVLANSINQSILVYSGNTNVVAPIKSDRVFDTAAGFQGVWHMTQSEANMLWDATANQYHGLASGPAASRSTAGIIGQAYAFDGISSDIVIQVPDTATSHFNIPVSDDFTIGAWVYADSSDSASGTIWDKGYREPSEYYLRLGTNSQFVFSVSQPTGYNERYAMAELHHWKYVVSVKKGNQQYLYLDGICLDSVGAFTAHAIPLTQGGTLYLGRSATNDKFFNYFRGKIDEVEFINRAMNSDWIQLSYRNQRPMANWIEFQ